MNDSHINASEAGASQINDWQLNGSQAGAPAVISPARLMSWLVQRELWENRSIYLAPLAVAALFLFGFLISVFHLPGNMRAALALDPMQQREAIEQPYTFAALLIMGTTFIVALFYCLDALHSERRDRSILFWKSLPVSDLMTVLSKASIPILVIPLLTAAITAATQWIMLLISSAALVGSGLSAATLWIHSPVFQMWPALFFHLLAVHGLYYAPIYGWLLLVSGWARRAAFLWASLPLLAIGFVEKIAFNTAYLAHMLAHRIGGPEAIASIVPNRAVMQPEMLLTVSKFLMSPGLWIGLVIFAAFVVAAVRLRRYQGPI